MTDARSVRGQKLLYERLRRVERKRLPAHAVRNTLLLFAGGFVQLIGHVKHIHALYAVGLLMALAGAYWIGKEKL